MPKLNPWKERGADGQLRGNLKSPFIRSHISPPLVSGPLGVRSHPRLATPGTQKTPFLNPPSPLARQSNALQLRANFLTSYLTLYKCNPTSLTGAAAV